ncbi:uncharacterized protein LOC129600027 isoform X2 [Paramacrobiotus metropolitanus]|uniref:uncharacterized protein LOC129600027 isoform X2 n=1 Tax=Paramacrobiotus metropolitanus TaxID=2943436 RepID=UPI0024461984|nr:uncharacterized protein LOC129600027 isoform X2 [Paramacrobiotus metropolitanus]XP_055354388.1 uncharacterized protein LOC129600027 isoform X2 [Paramacrobiotus metropolitanus]
MYIFPGGVCAWDSVNVLADGLLQQGYCRHVLPDGLLIDFLLPNAELVFVEFGNIYDCSGRGLWRKENWTWFYFMELDLFLTPLIPENPSIQALMRFHPGRPWIWYPARLLTCAFCIGRYFHYVVVEVTVDGQTIRAVLPPSQIRYTPSAEEMTRRRLNRSHFIVREASLPLHNSAAVDQQCVDWLIDRLLVHEFRIMSTTGGRLVYFTRENGKPLHDNLIIMFAEAVKDNLQNGDKEEKEATCNIPPKLPKKPLEQMDGNCERGIPLPVELMAVVFQCLDTIGRQRCRRTCFLWNSILTSRPLCKDLLISADPHCHYDILNCLLKYFVPGTECIAIQNAKPGWAPYGYDPVLMLIGDDSIKLPPIKQVLFHRCVFGEIAMRALLPVTHTVHASVEKRIGSIVWKNCSFVSSPDSVVLARIPYAVIDPNSVALQDLWNLVERNLIWRKHQDFDRLAAVIWDCVEKEPYKVGFLKSCGNWDNLENIG